MTSRLGFSLIIIFNLNIAHGASNTTEELKAQVQARLDAYPYKASPEASVYRGNIVFLNYCATCHGPSADGQGRAARMYDPKPSNLRASMMNDQYKSLIIRNGGKSMARSEFMPPWGDELTDEQTRDVVNYLRSISPSEAAR